MDTDRTCYGWDEAAIKRNLPAAGNPVMVNRHSHYGDGWDNNRANTVVLSHWLWCPGCMQAHAPESRLPETRPDYGGPLWDWDGNLTSPTFSPSLLVYASAWDGQTRDAEGRKVRGICHSFIRAGRWEFLGDSQHPLAGQTVPLVPVPDWLCGEQS